MKKYTLYILCLLAAIVQPGMAQHKARPVDPVMPYTVQLKKENDFGKVLVKANIPTDPTIYEELDSLDGIVYQKSQVILYMSPRYTMLEGYPKAHHPKDLSKSVTFAPIVEEDGQLRWSFEMPNHPVVIEVKFDAEQTVSTPEDLKEIIQDVADGINDFAGQTVHLNTDINLTEDPTWKPMGTPDYPFNGTLDGQGHTITWNIQVNADGSVERGGFFGYTGPESVIKDLFVLTAVTPNPSPGIRLKSIGSSTGEETVYIGGLTDKNEGIISKCYVAIDVEAEINGIGYIGGIAGYNSGTIQNSYTIGNITLRSTSGGYAGGIAGYTAAGGRGIQCCYATGAISHANGYAGGIAGYQGEAATIANCIVLSKSITGKEAGKVTAHVSSTDFLNRNYTDPLMPGIWETSIGNGTPLEADFLTAGVDQGHFLHWKDTDWHFGDNTANMPGLQSSFAPDKDPQIPQPRTREDILTPARINELSSGALSNREKLFLGGYGWTEETGRKLNDALLKDGSNRSLSSVNLAFMTDNANADITGMFSGCTVLSSVFFGAEYPQHEADPLAEINPNCLKFFVEGISVTPRPKTWTNILKGCMAMTDLTLTDGGSYNNPAEINLNGKKLLFTRNLDRFSNGVNGWETICLPFPAVLQTGISTAKVDKSPFVDNEDQSGHYWLKAFAGCKVPETPDAAPNLDIDNSLDFGYSQTIEAQIPYIICLPDKATFGTNGLGYRGKTQTLTFRATDEVTLLPATTEPAPVSPEGSTYSFCGTYRAVNDAGYYIFTGATDATGLDRFEKNATAKAILPFRAYFIDRTPEPQNVSRMLSIDGGGYGYDGFATGIQTLHAASGKLKVTAGGGKITLESTVAEVVSIYTIDGRTAATVALEANTAETVTLPSGVFLVNGQKVMNY